MSLSGKKNGKEAKLDLNKIEGTGKNGVILKEDIMSLNGF